MKIAFIYGTRLSSRLTKFWTGSTCYHVAWVVDDLMFDMNLIRRVRLWPHYPADRVLLIDSPVDVSLDYLFNKLKSDNNTYGWRDYCLFALRPLFHLFGKSTPNASGVICSEMVADDLQANGWPYQFAEVPSPADMELALLGRVDAIHFVLKD